LLAAFHRIITVQRKGAKAQRRRDIVTSHFTAKTAKIAKSIAKDIASLSHRTIAGLRWGISGCVIAVSRLEGV